MRSTLRPSGSGSGSAATPVRCAALSMAGSSSNASGFPVVLATSCSRTRSASPGAVSRRSAAAAIGSRPANRRSGSPGAAKLRWSSSRAPNRITTPSACSRRATKISASADGPSSHCASSMRQRRPSPADTSETRVRTATATRKGSSLRPGVRPNAAPSAADCGAGNAGSWSKDGIEQLMQRGEGQCHLRLNTGPPKHA